MRLHEDSWLIVSKLQTTHVASVVVSWIRGFFFNGPNSHVKSPQVKMTNGLGSFPSQIYEKADMTHHPFYKRGGRMGGPKKQVTVPPTFHFRTFRTNAFAP